MANALKPPPAGGPLDPIRIVAPAPSDPPPLVCRSEFSRLFQAVSIKTGAVYEINCRSHRCPRHVAQWGNMWGSTIGRMLEAAPAKHVLLVNLTTAERIEHTAIKEAMELFVQRLRKKYGPLKYVRVAEMNRRHTQSHYHCIFVFDDLEIEDMPPRFIAENQKRKNAKLQELSWPPDVYEHIRDSWQDCLERKASVAKKTRVVWCQPPKSRIGAAKYAVGYITGKSGKGKGEDLDGTFKGRKITYSRNFFTIRAQELWQEILAELFGPRDPDDRFFWQGRTDEPLPEWPALGPGGWPLDNPAKFTGLPVMRERYVLAKYYRQFGQWPPGPPGPILEVNEFNVQDNVQLSFGIAT